MTDLNIHLHTRLDTCLMALAPCLAPSPATTWSNVSLRRYVGQFRRSLILLVWLSLSACQLTPVNPDNFVEIIVPEVRGELHDQGLPVQNIKISVARNEGAFGVCERPLSTVLTDSAGVFVLAAISKEGQPSLNQALEKNWQVCAELDGKSWQLWQDRHTGVMWSGTPTLLKCNIKQVLQGKRPACSKTE